MLKVLKDSKDLFSSKVILRNTHIHNLRTYSHFAILLTFTDLFHFFFLAFWFSPNITKNCCWGAVACCILYYFSFCSFIIKEKKTFTAHCMEPLGIWEFILPTYSSIWGKCGNIQLVPCIFPYLVQIGENNERF